MNRLLKFIAIFLMVFAISCQQNTGDSSTPVVQTGLDRVNAYRNLFQGKRLGIVTNHTAVTYRGKHITEIFSEMKGVTITALFGPEHGIYGAAEAGAKVASRVDPQKKIPIYSLYGKTRKPTVEMLKNVDMLVFDIQDIGARFYTYIYTMALAMEAAAENHIPFVVLDRPNPINGIAIEGNILDTAFKSFVGLYPLPVRHGMTVGELAKMINGEKWLKNGVQANLTVIPMKGWKREMWFDQTGLKFIKTSPNMPDLETATVYPGMCLFEGTNVSAGRGTDRPFLIFGAPWMYGKKVSKALNQLNLPGVDFRDTTFIPRSIPGVAEKPKYLGDPCSGVRVVVTDRNRFLPYLTGIYAVKVVHDLYPNEFQFREKHFDRLTGTDQIRKSILKGSPIKQLVEGWQPGLKKFKNLREKYLIYR